jgi:hypothetical protein
VDVYYSTDDDDDDDDDKLQGFGSMISSVQIKISFGHSIFS